MAPENIETLSPTELHPRDSRFEHGATNYDIAAYVLLAAFAASGAVLLWAIWQIVVHLSRWHRS